jgi:hypothetical protein
MKGGHNKKSIQEHILNGTYRPSRHGELPEELKKYWYKGKTTSESIIETDNLYSDIIKLFYDDSPNTNPDGYIINMNQVESDKTLKILKKKYPDTELNLILIHEVVKNEFIRKLNLTDKLKRQEFFESLKNITPIK